MTSNPASHTTSLAALVSTYASAQFLGGRLRNLLDQTHQQLQIYVLDAASPQDEQTQVESVRHLVQPPRQLHYWRTEQRIGLYTAWNQIIERTDAEYLATCNTDDLQDPQYFQQAIELLQSGYDLIWCWWYATRVPNQGWPPKEHDGIVQPEPGGTCGHFPVWRRELHQHYGPFDDRFRVLGDAEWWQRLRHHGVRIGCIQVPMGCYLSRGQDNLYYSARDSNGRKCYLDEERLLRETTYD